MRKGTFLKSKEGTMFKIYFKFERLLDFCYKYGRVGHLIKDCGEKNQGEDGDDETLPFGPWLRASPMRGRQPDVRDGGKNPNSRKMVFKPNIIDKVQKNDSNKINMGMHGSQKDPGEISEKDDTCINKSNLKNPLNESCLSKD